MIWASQKYVALNNTIWTWKRSLNLYFPIGPLNNIFQTKYCSPLSVLDDPLCLKEDGFAFLTGRKLTGRLWLFPPTDLVVACLSIIRNLKWTSDSRLHILLVIPDHALLKAITFFRKIAVKKHWCSLQKKGRDANKLAIKVRSRSFVLVSIGSYND